MAYSKDDAIAVIRSFLGNIQNELPIERAYLFGSYARGRQTATSDIDFLVEFERPTYDNFIGLSRGLEKLFGRKVEILTPEGLDSIRVGAIADSIRKALAYA